VLKARLVAEHEQALCSPPLDRQDELAAASRELHSARSGLADMNAAAARCARGLGAPGPFAGLSRHARDERRLLHDRLASDTRRAAAACERYQEIAARVERLRQEQDASMRFESLEGWRRDDIVRLHGQLDHHWAEVVAACVAADDPLAYGIDKLRHARTTMAADRQDIDAGVPDDRAGEWQQARGQLPGMVRERHHAEILLADSQAQLQDSSRRRWSRRDHEAVANAEAQVALGERRLEQAMEAERDLRERLGTLAEHQERRQRHIADISPQRKDLDTKLAQIDAALDRTRPDRVAALAENPPEHLVRRIGPAPSTPAGRAVWCHHALDIEAVRDRNDSRSPRWTGWRARTDRARHEIAVADRVLEAGNDRPEPIDWARLAQQAGVILDRALRVERNRAATERTGQWQQPRRTPWIDPAAERPEPGISQ
jgi:hypothetical protein